jgi:hydrogenase expression/formation protein HypE
MTEPARTMDGLSCPAPLASHESVLLGHGSGGKLSAALIRDIFVPAFRNPVLAQLNDQATVSLNGSRVAFTTDSFVVKPLFFPGGDIGSLAVHGTINDLAMGGAKPLFLSAAFIIEEGFSLDTLRQVVESLRRASDEAGVCVVTGDTKVVEKGCADGLFINTSGIGLVRDGIDLSASRAQPGDKILVSGAIGNHGIAILACREGIGFETTIQSDSAALHLLVESILDSGAACHCFRDPTRGGVSSALNEIAEQSGVTIELDEREILVHEQVKGACEMLGLDPLYVANEGKMIAVVAAEDAHKAWTAMKSHSLGTDARIIGTVSGRGEPLVTIRTALGTTRIVDMLAGDQLPRIC